ncbi:MAG: hypothetical protein MRY64_00845 [Hyphomonadaceae bacterium]|nr:hypothetical protein [Hyphomonadaceae bacterium]
MSVSLDLLPMLSMAVAGLTGLIALRLVWVSYKMKQDLALDLPEDED